MKFLRTKKGAVLLATLVVAAAAAVGAYAYFTSTGTGSGSASVGTAANNLVVTGTVDTGSGNPTALTPGGDPLKIAFTVANPSNFNQSVSSIHLSGVVACSAALDVNNQCPAGDDISGNKADSGFDASTQCDVSAFTMTDVAVTDGDIAPNATAQTLTEEGVLNMADNTDASPGDGSGSQNACASAHLALSFTSS
jgi:hypothetical protein